MNIEVTNLTKKLQADWAVGVIDKSNISDCFRHFKSFDSKIQLKLLVSLLTIDAEPEFLSNIASVHEALSYVDEIEAGEWNLWLPLIAECVRGRLNRTSSTSTYQTFSSSLRNPQMDVMASKMAEFISTSMESSNADHFSCCMETSSTVSRKYFYKTSATAPPQILHCTFSGEEPDYLRREFEAEEARQRTETSELSSGFSFK